MLFYFFSLIDKWTMENVNYLKKIPDSGISPIDATFG